LNVPFCVAAPAAPGTRPCESLDEQGRDSESPEKVRDGTASRIVKLDGRVLAVPHRILAERG